MSRDELAGQLRDALATSTVEVERLRERVAQLEAIARLNLETV